MLSCTTQYNLYAGFMLSFIKENTMFCNPHLNISRICRIFYLGGELTFLLHATDREPQWQAAIEEKGSRGAEGRARALASPATVPSKASREGGCWGWPRRQSKSTVMTQVPGQTSMAHLWVTSAAQINRVPSQAWHSCNTAAMQLWWD